MYCVFNPLQINERDRQVVESIKATIDQESREGWVQGPLFPRYFCGALMMHTVWTLYPSYITPPRSNR